MRRSIALLVLTAAGIAAGPASAETHEAVIEAGRPAYEVVDDAYSQTGGSWCNGFYEDGCDEPGSGRPFACVGIGDGGVRFGLGGDCS